MLEIVGHKTHIKPWYYEIVTIPGRGRYFTGHFGYIKNEVTKKTCIENLILGPDTELLKIHNAGNILIYDRDESYEIIPRDQEGLEYQYYLNPIFRTQFILKESGYVFFPHVMRADFIPTSLVQVMRAVMRTHRYEVLPNQNIQGEAEVSLCNSKMSIKFENAY